MKKTKKFWNFKAKEDENRGELTLYGEISDVSWWGDEITPKAFKDDLDALGDIDVIDIYINSSGGDVFAGDSIYNILKRHNARKIVHIDGLAASIASIIAMVGDEIIMAENALMMIHEAWTYARGNKRDLAKMIDALVRIDDTLSGVYAARTGKNADEIADMMQNETWFTAAEAMEQGFADKVEANKKIAASASGSTIIMNGVAFDMSRFEHAPEIAPCNGADTQPVEEIAPENTGRESTEALNRQREMFNNTREKIMKTYEKENTK